MRRRGPGVYSMMVWVRVDRAATIMAESAIFHGENR